MYNRLALTPICPKCTLENPIEVEFHFGALEYHCYQMGDTLRWQAGGACRQFERPPGGNYVGEAWATCPICNQIFGLTLTIQNDSITDAATDPTKIIAMADDAKRRIMFWYLPEPFGSASARIATEQWKTYFNVSTVMSDPLLDLMSALVQTLQWGEGRCRWWWEPGESRWLLRREGDILHITILSFTDFCAEQPDEQGAVEFAAMCDLWHFAQKVHMIAQKIAGNPLYHFSEQHRVPNYSTTAEYRTLHYLLDQHDSTP